MTRVARPARRAAGVEDIIVFVTVDKSRARWIPAFAEMTSSFEFPADDDLVIRSFEVRAASGRDDFQVQCFCRNSTHRADSMAVATNEG